jgi:hypothetical protein
MVQSLSDVTTRILGHLQDPMSEGRPGTVAALSSAMCSRARRPTTPADSTRRRRRLQVHHRHRWHSQQSAQADAAAHRRSLHRPVQRSRGSSQHRCRPRPGYPHPATLTNINEDFNKNTAEKSGWKINDFSKPIILVIKKNVTTLTALHKWLKALNAEGDGRISDVPMLLIDDEADNASINTNKEDLDPTERMR